MTHEDDNFDLPAGFREQLKKASDFPGNVPAEVDERILQNVRQMAAVRRRRFRFVMIASTIGIAAAVIILAFLFLPHGPAPANSHVDIVDAFLLEKRRQSGDTTVTETDVQHLAMLAVRVDNTGGTP